METAWYYQQELHQLRTLAAEFSKKHPDVAPLLAGSSSDPDVERLLEGTAYLTGLLTQKIEESYNTIAENLCALVLPQLLCGTPSCTIMQFTPKAALNTPLLIPKGSHVGSRDVDGVSCVFSTTRDMTLLPIHLSNVSAETELGHVSTLNMTFSVLTPTALQGVDRIRLYCTDTQNMAAQKFFFLLFHTTNVRFICNGKSVSLPPSYLKPVGFEQEDALFPYGAVEGSGYRILQEYYAFPQKFSFFDVMLPKQGLPLDGAGSFTCSFELAPSSYSAVSTFTVKDFTLFAVPAVNVFAYETRPIKADLTQSAYTVCADSTNKNAYVPYKVKKVVEINSLGKEVEYTPLLVHSSNANTPSYMVNFPKKSDGTREMQIAFMHMAQAAMPTVKSLSLEVLYTNGETPRSLKIGDIREPLSTSSVLAEFTNITVPTRTMQAAAEGSVFWSMLAHLHLHYLPLAEVKTLKALLITYLPTKFDAMYTNALKQHIESIVSVESQQSDILWKGRPQRNTDITIELDMNAFSSVGSMFLFGAVVARFLHESSPINAFLRVIVKDSLNQRCFQWQKHQSTPSLL